MARPGASDRRRANVGLLTAAVVLGGWELAGRGGGQAADLVASPSVVVRALLGLVASGELARHGWVSLQALAGGFVLGAITGVLAGILLGRSRWLRGLCDPVVMALHVTPRIALLPILVLWLGVGVASKVAIAFLSAVFPVLVNTQAAAQHVEALWVRAVRAFGARRLQVVAKVVLPATAPAVMAGLRLGLGRAVVGVVVGEMYVSVAGVGQLLQLYGNAGRTAETMAVAVVVAACGAAGVAALHRLETRLAPWRQDLEA
jgi:NitT/TauT family transport system permease protein